MARKQARVEPERPPARRNQLPDNGAEPESLPRQRPRRLGLGAAQKRAAALAAGANHLPPHKALLLRYTGRLAVHFENLSALTYYQTELRQDGEPRAALKLLLDLDQRITDNLAIIFPDDTGDDPLSTMFGRGRP